MKMADPDELDCYASEIFADSCRKRRQKSRSKGKGIDEDQATEQVQ